LKTAIRKGRRFFAAICQQFALRIEKVFLAMVAEVLPE
jgi:hypothetical protein